MLVLSNVLIVYKAVLEEYKEMGLEILFTIIHTSKGN